MSASSQAITATTKRPRVSAWKDLRILLPYIARYKGGTIIGLVITVAMGLVGNMVPLLIGALTDCLSGAPLPGALSSGIVRPFIWFALPYYHPLSRQTVNIFCLALVGVVLVKGFLSYFQRSILIGVSREIEYDIRNNLLIHLLRLEPEFYVRHRTGELMSRCTNDLNNVRMVLGPGIMYSATTVVTMLAAIMLMLKLSPLLTLWVLIPVPVVAIVTRYFGKQIHVLFEKIQEMLATLSARAQENLAGVRVVRAYAQEDAERAAFDAPNRQYVARNMQLIRTWSMFMPALTGLIGMSFLIVLFQGGRLVMLRQISLGTLIAFSSYVGLLIWPMIALGWVTNIFQRGAASMGRLNYLLTADPKIDDARARSGSADDIRGEIEFRNLSFTYPTQVSADAAAPSNGKNGAAQVAVLRNVNLSVPAGSTLAIVGPTGSGKSTLAALVARLWEAPEGTLFLDGRPIREWPLQSLHRGIGFVPQDTFLFSETLRENIAFGVSEATDDEVERAAVIANLYGEIEEFPQKFETMVGERGITLSGGQKQRAALARAVIRDPRILILDDSLSSVDTDTEEKILRRLSEVMRSRTTILISHRCSTVKHADQIVVLRDGGIVERGTHDELLRQGGYYCDLYQKQLLEEELERA
jgi:ATP-binding cassette subfamily B multidrug efflux pump